MAGPKLDPPESRGRSRLGFARCSVVPSPLLVTDLIFEVPARDLQQFRDVLFEADVSGVYMRNFEPHATRVVKFPADDLKLVLPLRRRYRAASQTLSGAGVRALVAPDGLPGEPLRHEPLVDVPFGTSRPLPGDAMPDDRAVHSGAFPMELPPVAGGAHPDVLVGDPGGEARALPPGVFRDHAGCTHKISMDRCRFKCDAHGPRSLSLGPLRASRRYPGAIMAFETKPRHRRKTAAR